MRQWTAPPTPPPALIIAVAVALMGLCSVSHAFPTAQQLRMLCRLSYSMQPGRSLTAVRCGAAGHAEGKRCTAVSFAKRSCFTEFAQHCASQHVCCLNHLFPDRSGPACEGAAGQGEELVQGRGVLRTWQHVETTGQAMPELWRRRMTTAKRAEKAYSQARKATLRQCAEACLCFRCC